MYYLHVKTYSYSVPKNICSWDQFLDN